MNLLVPTDNENLTACLGPKVDLQVKQFANGFLRPSILQDALNAAGRGLVLGPVAGENVLAAVFKTDGILELWFAAIWEQRRIDAVNVDIREGFRYIVQDMGCRRQHDDMSSTSLEVLALHGSRDAKDDISHGGVWTRRMPDLRTRVRDPRR